MGILAALERGLGVEPIEREVGSIIPLLSDYNQETVQHSTRSDDLPQAYRVHPWVYSAVRVIAQAVADVPIIAVKTGRPHKYTGLAEFRRIHGIKHWEDVLDAYKAMEGAEIVSNHAILDLLDNPLPEANLTRHELLQSVVTYLELSGNAYIEKIFSDKKKTHVVGLWPKIDPRYIWVIPGDDKLIAGYLYRRNAESKVFSADEIIHFMYFHPESPYYGLAPTEVLKQSLIADLRAIDWNRMFFEHDATPGGLLSSDQQLTRDQAMLARQMWEEQHRGVTRAHRIHVLGSGWKYQALTPTHKDMAFMDLRKWTREEVLATYGVPPVMVGLRQGINRATAQVERRDFYENTILPRLGKIEAVLNYSLVPKGAGIRLFFDVSAIQALQEDVELKARVGRLLKDQGYTINEMRAYHGLAPAQGTLVDSILVPMNLVPAGEASAKSLSREVTKESTPLTGTPEKYLPPVDLDPQMQVHRKYLPEVAMAGAARGVGVLEEIGMDVPVDWAARFNFQEEITRWLDEHLADTVKEIDGVTRKRCAKAIRRGIDEGKGAKAIARDLREEFVGMSKTRALTIARTEGGKAVSFGQHKLYSDTGIKKHEWHATLKGTRPAHVDAHMAYGPGMGIPIDEPFDVGGEYLMAPRMGSAPENNINCYCEEIPVAEGYRAFNPKNIKGYETWLKEVEDKGEIHKYKEAIGAFFGEEGERYIKHLLEVARRGA